MNGVNKLNIEFSLLNNNKLSAQQERNLKTIMGLILNLSTTNQENVFFEQTQEILKLLASVLKQSQFAKAQEKAGSEIPYAEQALELATDWLHDHLYSKNLVNFDN
jgi:hypothetical protein